jgi:lipopolysaccharide export LptBFGC system permease protein LptF
VPIPLNIYDPSRGDVSFHDTPETARERAARLLRAGGAAAGRQANLAFLALVALIWRFLFLPLLLLLAVCVGTAVVFVANRHWMDGASAVFFAVIVLRVMWALQAAATRHALLQSCKVHDFYRQR